MESSNDDSCAAEKVDPRIKNRHSAAVEDGCTSNTNLQALAQASFTSSPRGIFAYTEENREREVK